MGEELFVIADADAFLAGTAHLRQVPGSLGQEHCAKMLSEESYGFLENQTRAGEKQ